ncbi:hypothetical protein C8Q73DRAFT_651595 [Cubamyces lactineus]|nr:hypothetical protein C8Q73DRAFT_651595 [Cubamyces lactineus]
MPGTLQQLPFRGNRTAPSFDSGNPKTLRRFFKDLEALFDALVTPLSEQQKKEAAKQYTPIEVSDLWAALPEYTGASSIYLITFKKVIQELYPGLDELRWTRNDLTKLVTERQAREFVDLKDYTAYYRQFTLISSYLKAQQWLGEVDEACFLYLGFSMVFREKINQRLQAVDLNHQ